MHDVKALAAARDWAERHQLDQPDLAPAVRWLADRVDALTAERDAARPIIDATRHWHAVRADRTTLGGTYSRACQALADAVAALPPSLGSPPARAQEGYPVSADAALHTCGALDGNGCICVGWEHDEATAHDWQLLPAGHAGRSADGHASGDHSGCTPGLCGYVAAEMLRPRKPTPVELRLAELEHRLGRLEDRVDEMRLEPEYDPADDAQGTAAPAESAVEPPARPAEGTREGDSVTEAHRAAEAVGYEIVATRLHRDGLGALVSGDVVASAVSASPTLAEAIDELRSILGPADGFGNGDTATEAHEAAEAVNAAIIGAAEAWRDWYTASLVRMQHLDTTEQALIDAIAQGRCGQCGACVKCRWDKPFAEQAEG